MPVAVFVAGQGGGNEVMVTSAGGLVNKGRGEMATGFAELLAIQVEFSQASLSLLGHLCRQPAEAGEASEDMESVLGSAEPLIVPAHRQQTVREIERHAHGAASLPVTGIHTLRRGDYN